MNTLLTGAILLITASVLKWSPTLKLFQHEGSPRTVAAGNVSLLFPPIHGPPRRSAG